MAHANVVLKGSLSHTVRLPGTSRELKLEKNKPYPTADQALIDYCKSRKQLFLVTETEPAPAEKASGGDKPAARGKPGKSGKSGKRGGGKEKVTGED